MEDWRRSKLEELKKETTTSNNGNMNGGGDDGSDGHPGVGRTEELKKTKQSTSRVRCSAVNCKHYVAAHPELAFHRFPRDPERSSKWLQALGNPNLADMSVDRLSNSYRVCSAHFHPSQFKRKADVHAGLNWDAVPSIQLDSESGRKQPILHQELPPNNSKQNCDARRSSAVDSYITRSHDQRRILLETKLTVPAGKVIVITRHPKPLISPLPLPKTSQSPLPRPTMLQMWALPPRRLPTMLQSPLLRKPQSTSQSPLPISNTSQPLISPLPKTSQSPLLPRPPPTMLQTPRPLLQRKPQSTSQSPLPMSNTSSEPEPESAAVREIALKRKVRNLQAQVSKLKTKVRVLKGLKKSTTVAITKKSVLQLMKKLLSATAYEFFRAQLNVAQRKAHGFRWSDRDKAFFLDLLRASPQCYRLMTDIFSMPSVRTLQRLMKPTDFNPGVDQNIVTTSEEVEENFVTTSEVKETTQPVAAEVCAAVTELQRAQHFSNSVIQ